MTVVITIGLSTIGLELEVEVATIGLPLSDGCYHYRDYRASAE